MGSQVTAALPPALHIEHLSKHFGGAKALNEVSLMVLPGEVHGLLGQNGSGKSTLIKILAGLHIPEPGARIEVAGQRLPLPLPAGASYRHGLSFVHQHLALVPSLTVTENLFASRYATHSHFFIDERREQRAAATVLGEFGVGLPPDAQVSTLLPVERALLAIVRAVNDLQVAGQSQGSGLLILDEPTPFLPKQDVERLFALIRSVVERGASVIFVSHDIDEVLEITDHATILRDGQVVATIETARTAKDELIEHIIGHKLDTGSREGGAVQRSIINTEVKSASGQRCRNVNLKIYGGEIVGLTGLIGSGYDELPYLMYGALPASDGQMSLSDAALSLSSLTPAIALRHRIVLIPGDRPAQGGVLDLSLLDNLSLPTLDGSTGGWKVNWSALRQSGQNLLTTYQVRPPNLNLELGNLSGGNQQKVVLAKWLQLAPQLILLDEPTQGVDVGAREEVWNVVRQAAAAGASVLCASSDHEQLAALCDRVLIFRRGELAHELVTPFSKEEISRLCYLEGDELRRNAL